MIDPVCAGAASIASHCLPAHVDQVLLAAHETGLGRDSKAQAEQVRAISVERITHKIGAVPPPLVLEIDEALRLHLPL